MTMPTDDNLGNPPANPNPPAPPAPNPAPASSPAPAPAVPPPAAAAPAPPPAASTVDPLEFERLKTHKVEQDRELEKQRKAIADEKKARTDAEQKLEAAKKLFFGEAAPADPAAALKEKEEKDRQAQETARQADRDRLVLENTLHRQASAQRLVLRDEDPDFADFVMGKVQRNAELSELAKSDPKKLLEKLKEMKLYVPASAEKPTSPAPMPEAAKPAGGGAGGPEAVAPKFANVKTEADLVAMGATAIDEFATAYPKRYAQMRAAKPTGLRRVS
jgi:hypothetical protein